MGGKEKSAGKNCSVVVLHTSGILQTSFYYQT